MAPPQPIHHTFSTPDPSLWLPLDAIGSVVTWEGKTYRVLGIYFAAGPERQDRTLRQRWIGENVNPQGIPRWYLIRTKRGREAVAERALEAAGITVLLPPLYFEAPRKKGRRQGRKPKHTAPAGEPFFPGYLFAQLAPGDAESWNRLRRAQGVEDVVGTQPEPLPVPGRGGGHHHGAVGRVGNHRLPPRPARDGSALRLVSRNRQEGGMVNDCSSPSFGRREGARANQDRG